MDKPSYIYRAAAFSFLLDVFFSAFFVVVVFPLAFVRPSLFLRAVRLQLVVQLPVAQAPHPDGVPRGEPQPQAGGGGPRVSGRGVLVHVRRRAGAEAAPCLLRSANSSCGGLDLWSCWLTQRVRLPMFLLLQQKLSEEEGREERFLKTFFFAAYLPCVGVHPHAASHPLSRRPGVACFRVLFFVFSSCVAESIPFRTASRSRQPSCES